MRLLTSPLLPSNGRFFPRHSQDMNFREIPRLEVRTYHRPLDVANGLYEVKRSLSDGSRNRNA